MGALCSWISTDVAPMHRRGSSSGSMPISFGTIARNSRHWQSHSLRTDTDSCGPPGQRRDDAAILDQNARSTSPNRYGDGSRSARRSLDMMPRRRNAVVIEARRTAHTAFVLPARNRPMEQGSQGDIFLHDEVSALVIPITCVAPVPLRGDSPALGVVFVAGDCRR